ncbi:MAG: adenylate/guanylate cyclase domain-containing protein [Pseudomonadota bacterium]
MRKQDPSNPFIKLVAGGEENFWSLTGKNTFRIGRGADCDILLPYPWVSRQHAMIQVEANSSHNLIDLGSANGTIVNGRRVYGPTRLAANDRITIGKSELVFWQETMASEAAGDEGDVTGDATVAFMQRELVTILVCDIRKFTPLSEEVGAGRISEFLAQWTKKVDSVVRKNGGQVDKFIGDAVLAVWGNGAEFSSVARALLSALEISVWTRKLGLGAPGICRELMIGAALNTGEAVMGNMGVGGQRDFTIVGDVVNVTFRLQEMTSRHKLDVILGESAYLHLREAEDCFTPHQVTVRGKAEDLRAYSTSFDGLRGYLANWKSIFKNEIS